MSILAYFLLTIVTISKVSGKTTSNATTACEEYHCSNNTGNVWHYRSRNNCEVNCTFMSDSNRNKIVSRVKHCDKYTNKAMLPLGYCVTTNETNGTAYVVPCPYDTGKGHKVLGSQNLVLTATTAQEQNTFMCSSLNRLGIHCHTCNESFGQSVFTFDLSCYSCERHYHGWSLYLFFETFFLTIFLVIILIFQISPTKGSMKVFVLFCQLNMVYLSLGTEPYFKYTFQRGSKIYIQVIKLFYGFWNLDFFRSVMPPFCVGPNLNNLDVMMLQYIPIVFSTILIAVAWFIVDLHERGFRPIVAVWRPFRRGLSHFSVTNDPKRKIVSFLATLVTLSSTKVIYIALLVTSTTRSHDCCGVSRKVLYLQPNLQIYGHEHAQYIFWSVVMVAVYVFLPVILLLFYSLQCFQDRLNKHCIRSHNIQMFAEAFYSMYKDGSNGQWDTRLFSTAYFFFRMLVLLCFVKVPVLYRFLGIALAHGFVLGLICLLRPYKYAAHTFLDALFFFIFLVASVFSTGIVFKIHQCGTSSFLSFLYVTFYILMGMPLLYILIQLIRYFVKALALVNIRSILSWRRRGYVEIGPYETEDSVAVDKDWVRTRNDQGRRVRQNEVIDSE